MRPAESADEAAIRVLVNDARLNPFGLDWQRFTVAESRGGTVVGCAQLKPHKEDIVELASLVVEEDWRGRGLGRRLIERLLAEATQPVWLMCRSSLVPLYRKFGFREVSPEDEQPAYFARIRRLASIYHWFRGRDEHLAIMANSTSDE